MFIFYLLRLKGINLAVTYFEAAFGLPANIYSEKKWNTLSGGERQRCIIICGLLLALSFAPNEYFLNLVGLDDVDQINIDSEVVLLLDEPCAACDGNTTLMIEKVLRETKLTMLIITHNSQQAERIGHRRLIFDVYEEVNSV